MILRDLSYTASELLYLNINDMFANNFCTLGPSYHEFDLLVVNHFSYICLLACCNTWVFSLMECMLRNVLTLERVCKTTCTHAHDHMTHPFV